MKEAITKNRYVFLVFLFLFALTLSLSLGSTKAKYNEIIDVCTIHLDFSEDVETVDSSEVYTAALSETESVGEITSESVSDNFDASKLTSSFVPADNLSDTTEQTTQEISE